MQRENERDQEIRAIQLRSNENKANRSTQVGGSNPILFPVPVTISSTAKNQLLNGDFSHSQRTWNSPTPLADDMNMECAYWFSNVAPSLGQVLATTDNFHNPGSANKTLKSSTHSAYDAAYADWDSAAGTARFGTDKTVDALLAGRFVIASRTHYVAFIVARASQYVVFPDAAYIYAGFWINNGGSSYWLKGSNPFALNGAVEGVATGIEQRYKVFARTDRATSFLSTEVTFAAGSGPVFASGDTVNLSWDRLLDVGIISYDIYRYTPSIPQYKLLARIESGSNTYIDNNAFDETAAGYPTATDDRSIALTTTRRNITGNVLNNIAIDGISAAWSTLAFPIKIPTDYNVGAGSEQWLRIGIGGLTGARLDLQVSDAVVTGTTNVESVAAQFVAGHAGLTCTLRDSNGVQTSNTIASFTDSTHIVLTTPVTNGTFTLTIHGGAPAQSLVMDCVHSSYGDGATFGHNDQDYTPPRPQYPVAAPNGSSQGGTGDGGGPTDGGGPECVEVNEPIVILYGNQTVEKRAADITIGQVVESANMVPNVITNSNKFHCPDIWYIETQNGCSLNASPSHPIFRSRIDKTGTPMDKLKVGDKVLTSVSGAYRQSKIVKLGPTGKPGFVQMLTCKPTPSFVAGRTKKGIGGLVCHNRKNDDPVLN